MKARTVRTEFCLGGGGDLGYGQKEGGHAGQRGAGISP